MLSAARFRTTPRRTTVLVLVAALVAALLVVPASASHQDRAELSQVQRKLARIRKVLENAKADAADLAAALEQADRDVASAQAALAEAQRRFRAAQVRRREAVLEAARARLEVEAQQAVIDRRAYATYVNSGASAMLTLMVDAESVGDLLDRSKLLDNVAKAANTELQKLVDAKIAADAARRRAVAAEQEAAAEEARMRERTAELEAANRELEAFSYSVSHDLRAPLRTIDGFSRILLEDYADRLDEEGEDYLGRVRAASRHMDTLIEDLLDLSRVSRGPLRREVIDLSAMARGIVRKLKGAQPERRVRFVAEEGVVAFGDANLLAVALENLLGNAFKFTQKEDEATIEFGAVTQGDGGVAYYVRDDGAGFDPRYADKLFGAFQRLHGAEEFEGTGIGLATVARIVHRHGGRVWAEGEVGEGATFYFTLGGGHRQGATPLPRKAEVQ